MSKAFWNGLRDELQTQSLFFLKGKDISGTFTKNWGLKQTSSQWFMGYISLRRLTVTNLQHIQDTLRTWVSHFVKDVLTRLELMVQPALFRKIRSNMKAATFLLHVLDSSYLGQNLDFDLISQTAIILQS